MPCEIGSPGGKWGFAGSATASRFLPGGAIGTPGGRWGLAGSATASRFLPGAIGTPGGRDATASRFLSVTLSGPRICASSFCSDAVVAGLMRSCRIRKAKK